MKEILITKGMDFQIPLEFWWSTDINLSLGMDQKVHPSWPISIINAMLKNSPNNYQLAAFFLLVRAFNVLLLPALFQQHSQ